MMTTKMEGGVSKALPRTTSPLITLLQKKRALNNTEETKKTGKPLKYTFNFSLDNKANAPSNKTTTTTTSKSTTTTTHKAASNSTYETSNKNNYNKYNNNSNNNNYNNTRYTPSILAMDKIKENIVNRNTKLDSRPTTPPDASYTHPRFDNRPSSIEFYEPGASSLSKPGGPDNDTYLKMAPLNKPGDLCRYIVSPPSKKYNVKKNLPPHHHHDTPPLRPPTPHGVYMGVQKGGDVPLEGLYCPPFLKPDLRISTRKSQRYKDILDKGDHHPTRLFTTPCLPVPSTLANPYQRGKSSADECVSMCELLATSRLSCRDRRSRDEINKARKLQMDLYIKAVKMKKKMEEERENEGRRHCDFSCSKSPVTLDRYNLEDEVFTTPTTPTPPPHSPQPSYKAKALYNFSAKDSMELSLQKGDVVYVWGVVDENWMKGEHHGSVGIFPSSYVQIFQSFDLPLSPSFSHLYSLLYNFHPQATNEISLRKGDIVRVLARVNGDWAKVELVKPRHIRERSPEARLYSSPSTHHNRSSSTSPLCNTLYSVPSNTDNNHRNNTSNNATTHHNDSSPNNIGLVPSNYIIPLDRNIETINFFRSHSPHELRTSQEFLNANKPALPAWKDMVVGVGGNGLFFTDDHNFNLSRNNFWKGDSSGLYAPTSKEASRKMGLFEQLYSPKSHRKAYENNSNNRHTNNDIKSNKSHTNTTNKYNNYNKSHNNTTNNNTTNDNNTNYNNHNNVTDTQNDFFIDESYLSDLEALNASIDPLFYLNLSKIKACKLETN